MNIKLNKKTFEKHIENISKAIQPNIALTSLQGVVIEATESYIELLASNGNLSIKERIPLDANIEVITPGKVLVPGKIFKDVIKQQEKNITIDANDSYLTIKSEDSKTKINLFNLNDYPIIDFNLMGSTIKLNADRFKEVIKNVSFAASENDRRIILNGVNLKIKDNKLTVSATNSYRLATEVMDIVANEDNNITILANNLSTLIPSRLTGEIELRIDDNKINLTTNNTTIQSKLLDGIFPELQGLIPTEFNYVLKIEGRELLSLLDKVTVISGGGISPVRLSVEKNRIFIETKRDEIGNSIVNFGKYEWEGDDFQISFDANFVRQALKTFKGEIKIKFLGELKPFVIVSESNKNLLQLILPHRNF